MSDQHLNTAQAEMHKLVDQFYADWLARRLSASDEAKWPLMMTSEEWWEQFIIWMQEENGLPAGAVNAANQPRVTC